MTHGLSKLVCACALALVAATSNASAEDAAVTTDTTTADEHTTAAGVEEMHGRLDGITEQIQVLQSDTDKLKKFKFSGYLQARWETGEAKSDSVRVSGSPAVITPANNERFYVRRARLKLTYDSSPLSQAVVYFDGGQDRTIRLLEAYVTLLDPWTILHKHALTIGQMNVPFGYEIERSSSVRELPERSRAENVLFAGERDRGVKIVSQWSPWVQTTVAVMNGGGVNHPDFPTTDPTHSKDWLGRLRASHEGKIDGAVSYYDGRNTTPLTGPDIETDKTRLGVDAQWYYELPTFGGGSLRGELFDGTEVNPDSVRTLVKSPTSDDPTRTLKPGAVPEHLATDFTGWYAMWVQNLGERFQTVARYDAYDPNIDLDHDQFTRTAIGLSYFYDGFTRVTVAYDMPRTDKKAADGGFEDPNDNLWTLQFQHKF